ncbi:MAG: HAD-IIIA family hydrolase [Bacteroidales bacterium]|jgi:histidinol-phosphate phosphatase family protein|nr:HAD-IIIA family hydrolase [Bacteroidales bacterium]
MNLDFIKEIDASWSLFLDRDGVINQRKQGGYIQHCSEFRLLEGVQEAIAVFKQIFGHIFVVTNQQGIGKKLMTEEDLQHIHDYMETLLKIKFDRIYHSPFLAQENNIMRKPNRGMAIQAKKDFPAVDLSRSIMAGDSQSDILFGKASGMKTVYISKEENTPEAHLVCASLYDFAKIISGKQ